jgi:type IV pilus assembly protein PilC
MSWILYSIMTPDGNVVRRNGLFENIDILDQDATRRGEQIVNFFELPDAVYHARQMITGRMGDLEVAEFCSMLSMYVTGGVDLQSALTDMENSARTSAFKHVVADLRLSLLNGFPLSEALKKTGQFPEEVLALAKIGEESGTLDRVLRDAGAHIERVVAIKSAAKRAMIYPAFTLAVILGGALFWLSFVIPKINEVFKSINLKLPPSTLALVAASDWVRAYWWFIIFIIFALPVSFFLARRNEKFRYETDRIAWHLPIFGRIVSGSQTAFYFQYLNLMYGAGVVITQALETLTKAVQNRYLRSRVMGVIEHLRAGEPLVKAVERTGIFEPLAVRMIGIGESTGNLEDQLKKLGEIYYNRVNALVEVLSKVLEPVLLIFMAGLFGFFIVSVIGPIYGAIGSLGK